MSSDVLGPALAVAPHAGETDTESPASAPPTSTSFTFPQATSPPPVPPKPSSMSLTVAPPAQPHAGHTRSQSTSTTGTFLRLGSGKRQKNPMSMYSAEGASAPASMMDVNGPYKPRPEPIAKPSWLKRTTSGSKAIASSMGLSAGAGAARDGSGRTSAPLLPPRDRARVGSFLGRDVEELSQADTPGRPPSTTPPDGSTPSLGRSSTSISDSPFAPLPPPPQRANPPILPLRGRSEDMPRAQSQGLGLGPRGAGLASRINAWTNDAASSSAGRNATGLLKAAPGAIGSAVQSGWGQIRNGRSASGIHGGSMAGAPSTSTSGMSSLSSFANKSTLPSSSSHLDMNDTGLNERDGPHLAPQAIRRPRRIGKRNAVFGVEPVQSAAEFPAVQEVAFPTRESPREVKRKACLPAIALRCVDYLEVWAPKEEGIFRISGRSTHINVLRKYFDEGADLELVNCDPGDIDPHAIASMYKAYLRELPGPILTPELSPKFDDLLHRHLNSRATERDFGAGGMGGMASLHVGQASGTGRSAADLTGGIKALLEQLPPAHWWMLSDLALLLGHTAQHSNENKMTLGNLLMVLCPSLSLTPTFLRQLVDHHGSLFTLEPLAEVPEGTTIGEPAPRATLALGAASDRLAPAVAVMDGPKFSTPIADRFARTGPIELSLRDKPT